jgi:tannase/feruloyl esterase
MQIRTVTRTRTTGPLFGWAVALMASTAFIPSPASAQAALPNCSGLAAVLQQNADITSATSVVVPAAGSNLAYCNVQITVSDLAGPAFGYQTGQAQTIKVGIGLPLSAADGGSGGMQGAWNGRIEDLGGGGYAGSVGSTTTSTNAGYVGSSTDTGHSGGTGTFALNNDDTLNFGLIRDFFYNGIHDQEVWSKKLTLMYYGMAQKYAYWNGCSTGGGQGTNLAQRFPQDYDGILAGADANNWDRFTPAQEWPAVVMNAEVGYPILAAKLSAVQQAAIGSCQNKFGGTPDGIIQDPRSCQYDATAYVCGQPTAVLPGTTTPDTTNCLTPAEAGAIDDIWNGPPGPTAGPRTWFGIERGASFTSLAGTSPNSIPQAYLVDWTYQNPAFDWHTLTIAGYLQFNQLSEQLFHQVSGRDDPNLSAFNARGAKMITYQGFSDPLIPTRGLFNYYNRVEAAMGGLAATQSFYRLFPFPGNGHCGGTNGNPNQPTVGGLNDIPLINSGDLFNSLVNWVENGVAPTQITAYNSANEAAATVSRPICMYPNTLSYNGSGSIYSASSFSCVTQTADQLANAETVVPDTGPVPVQSIADTHDYNADHIADVLWRDTSGNLGMWLMNGKSISQSAVLGNVSTNYAVVGERDFAGQGYSSIVWRDAAGDTSVWQLNGTTVQSSTALPTSSLTPAPTNWSIVATGDFNADGMGDILWEDNTGNLLIWFMNGSQISSTLPLGKVPANWTVVGADGNGWIFFRNTVTGDVGLWLTNTLTGAVVQTIDFGAVPLNWTIAGIGDFNHSGYSDILWRDNLGNVGMWMLQPVAAGGNGGVKIASTAVLGNVPLNWSIAQTGDFNGDLKADILWVDKTGNVGAWFMNGTTISSVAMYGNVGTNWSIQAMNSE